MKVLGEISLLLTYLIIVTFKLLTSINVKKIFHQQMKLSNVYVNKYM